MEKLVFYLLFISILTSYTSGITLRNGTRVPQKHQGSISKVKPVQNTSQSPKMSTISVNPKLCDIKIFRKLRVSWMDAFGICKGIGNGTELVSLQSEEDFNLVSNALKDVDAPLPVVFWTSGVDLIEEGLFIWMSDGLPLKNVTFWSNGQPDNLWDSEHCLALRRRIFDKNYKLTDENCHLAGAFVCGRRC